MIRESRKVMFTLERIYSKIDKAALQPSWFGNTTDSQWKEKTKLEKNGEEGREREEINN